MSKTMIRTRFAWIFIYAATAVAGDVVIHLESEALVSRQVIRYQCDANGAKLGY
jgi:hypothetical protein